mmetsp:Transcript_63479/g.132084  ORF Transcript_63479/g.132084 Transcript_63479/m.132084 type:complete len:214 (+) Transcript_63479:964-1605(+)
MLCLILNPLNSSDTPRASKASASISPFLLFALRVSSPKLTSSAGNIPSGFSGGLQIRVASTSSLCKHARSLNLVANDASTNIRQESLILWRRRLRFPLHSLTSATTALHKIKPVRLLKMKPVRLLTLGSRDCSIADERVKWTSGLNETELCWSTSGRMSPSVLRKTTAFGARTVSGSCLDSHTCSSHFPASNALLKAPPVTLLDASSLAIVSS